MPTFSILRPSKVYPNCGFGMKINHPSGNYASSGFQVCISLVMDQGCQIAYFLTKKKQFGLILEGLGMEDVGIFYGHLFYLLLFGIFCDLFVYFIVIWYIFPRFGTLYQDKSGNPVVDEHSTFKSGLGNRTGISSNFFC
jgi:hypothetical protein